MPYEDLDYDEAANDDRVFEWVLGGIAAALVLLIGVWLYLI